MRRTETRDEEAGRLAVAAGNLLLNEPGPALAGELRRAGYDVPAGTPLAQIYYDRLAIPQSGLYLPSYEHVFRKRACEDGVWHFPPPRHDGAAAVEAVYRRLGFRRLEVPANPMLEGRHIPGDHLGFMLVFAGTALEGIATGQCPDPAFAAALERFVANHLDGWVEDFCALLPTPEGAGYLEAVADAVGEAAALVRAAAARRREPIPA